jgi:hypothetical protein
MPNNSGWDSESWKRAAREYAKDRAGRPTVVEIEPERLARLRRLLGDDISLDRAWHELNDPRRRPTAQIAVEAILHAVRERGTAALKERENVERLSRCDEAALAQIDARIAKGNAK